MTRHDVRDLLRRHHEATNGHDAAALEGLYAEDAVLVSPMFDTVRGRRAIRQSFERLFAVFPDYTIVAQDELFIAEGHRAAQFGTVTATQRLELFGLPPIGQRIEYHAARLFTVRDHLIAYERRLYDFGGVLERLEKTRVDRELATASAVQQTLMARRNSLTPSYEIVGASLPCRTIGGDFVDYVDLPGGEVWMALGDVSGKGPAAALVAAMLQGMFTMVAAAGTSPDRVLARLNDALCRRGISPSYATLFCAQLMPNGTLTYANAGHTPPLLVTTSRVEALTSGGPMLGLFETAGFPQATVSLASGDTLVAYSDGVTEAEGPDAVEFGMGRLVGATRDARAWSVADLVDRVIAEVKAFSGPAALVDDATIVAVRRR
jgi:steroid delta-isomerase-like uncharacterized protein